jgi:hypothetical protein
MAKVMENCFLQNFENKFFESLSTKNTHSNFNVLFPGSEAEYLTVKES